MIVRFQNKGTHLNDIEDQNGNMEAAIFSVKMRLRFG
jgi:hypothetical protein